MDEFYDIPAIKDLFKDVWSRSENDKEVATWVVRNALPPVFAMTGLKIGEDTHASPGRAPSNAVLQVHTHPRKFGAGLKAPLSPEPSTEGGNTGKGDWGVAIQTGRPVYVLSIFAIWKIMPVASHPVKIQVASSW